MLRSKGFMIAGKLRTFITIVVNHCIWTSTTCRADVELARAIVNKMHSALTYELKAKCSVSHVLLACLVLCQPQSHKVDIRTGYEIDSVLGHQSSCCRSTTTPWPGTIAYIYACGHTGLSEGADSSAIGRDELPTVSQQHIPFVRRLSSTLFKRIRSNTWTEG